MCLVYVYVDWWTTWVERTCSCLVRTPQEFIFSATWKNVFHHLKKHLTLIAETQWTVIFDYLSWNTSYWHTLCWNSEQRRTATENRGTVYFQRATFLEESGFGCGSCGVLAPSSVWKFNYWNNEDQTNFKNLVQIYVQKTQRKLNLNNCFILL